MIHLLTSTAQLHPAVPVRSVVAARTTVAGRSEGGVRSAVAGRAAAAVGSMVAGRAEVGVRSTADRVAEVGMRSTADVRSMVDLRSAVGMRTTACGFSEDEGMAAMSQDPAAQTSVGTGGKVQAAINYMAAHLNRPLRISTLTALTGLSASHFFALFKAATGATPLKYFLRLRMRLACKLLGERNLSVKEIAFFLDYADPFHFSRTFKQVYGFAPSHYRNRILDATPCCSVNQTSIVKTKAK